MELCIILRENLDTLLNIHEELEAKIHKTSNCKQIVKEIHETAENLVNRIRRNEELLVSKAEENSQLLINGFEDMKESIEQQVFEIETLLKYHEEIESLTSEDGRFDDKQEWKKAITGKMKLLSKVNDDLKGLNEFVEFRRCFGHQKLVDVFSNYGDIIISNEISDEKPKFLFEYCNNLIDFDGNNSDYIKELQKLREEPDSSYEAIPYL